MNFKNPLHCSIIVYIIFIISIIYIKPSMIFTKDGKIRSFGLNNTNTIYPLWLVTGFIAIICYYFISLIF